MLEAAGLHIERGKDRMKRANLKFRTFCNFLGTFEGSQTVKVRCNSMAFIAANEM